MHKLPSLAEKEFIFSAERAVLEQILLINVYMPWEVQSKDMTAL
jgi:hypothetical protein